MKEKLPMAIRLIIVLVLLLQSASEFPVFAQKSDGVTLDGKDMTLKVCLHEIERQSNYLFVYNEKIDLTVRITISLRNAVIDNVLERLAQLTGYTYSISGSNILVRNKEKAQQEGSGVSVLIGTVKDAKGEPVPGAYVVIKGDKTGTITDVDGNWSLTISVGNVSPQIEISCIGYTTQVVSVGKSSRMDVVLNDSAEFLDEVVVIGYGTMDKKELTSAVSHVQSKDFLSSSSLDPSMMIQGKVAGVSITNIGAGDPNNSASIQIRGVSSRSAGTGPLVVINGVPGELSNVNPNDIESFDILKDGAASAIYGTRGSNGVILITTKKAPTDGSIHTQYSGSVSFDAPMYELDMLTANEWVDYRVEGDGQGYDLGAQTDWMRRITRIGFSHKHTITLAGGTARTNYRVSADYKKADGIDLRSSREEYGARASINHTTKSGLLTFSANIAPRVAYLVNSDWNVFRYAIEANPTTPVMSVDNSAMYYDFTGQPASVNPAELLETELSDAEKMWIDWDATVKLNLLPLLGDGKADNHSLTTNLTFSDRQYNDFSGWYRPSTSTIAIKAGLEGQANRSYSKYRTHTLEWLANYSGSVGNNNIKAMLGYSYTYEQNSGLWASNSDFPNDGLTYNNLGTGAFAKGEGETCLGTSKSDSRLIAFFGRLSYDWKGRYLVTASLRYEGSSKFGTDNKWGLFPAVSAGWRISDEPFMDSVGWINDLKIRGDYGVTGNQNFNSYLSLSTMQAFGEYFYNGQWLQVWGPTKNVNPELRWEKGRNWNIGLDWAFAGYRVSGSFNYFNRTQQDLLGDYTVPVPPNLFNSTFVNVGTMKNQGFEFEINWKAVDRKKFSYDIDLSGAFMSNKFVSFSNSEFVGQDYYDTAVTSSPYPNLYLQRIEAGRSVGSFYMYKYAGIDPDGNWVVYASDGNLIKATDASEDDKRYVGCGMPKFTGSMTHRFVFGNFDLSVFLRTALGYDIFNIHDFMYGHRNFNGNVLAKAYGKNEALNPDSAPIVCDYFLERGDFLKIDDVTLGYTVHTKWKYLTDIRAFVSGKNLYTFTSFSGVDPATYQTNGLAPGVSLSGSYYPSCRQFIIGVQLGF